MEKRLDNILIEKAQPVINGEQKSVDIELEINNECRAFASTLSYQIARYKYKLSNLSSIETLKINYWVIIEIDSRLFTSEHCT